jgi:DNA-binding GntR family transcriptional regulator
LREILFCHNLPLLVVSSNLVNLFSKSAAPHRRGSSTQKPSQADRAYLEIRNGILKGALPVGVALSRRKLATELHISVPPVTEALLRLESEGLVESKPRVGTRVRIPTRQEVEDRSLLREALETQAARLFAERATPPEKDELHRMGEHVDQLYASCEKGSVDRDFLFSVNTRHMDLHLRIAEYARCPALRDAIEKEQVLIFNWLYDTAVQRRTLASNYHATLTAALTTGSPTAAAAAMRRHIRRGLSEVLAGLARIGKTDGAWRARTPRRSDA